MSRDLAIEVLEARFYSMEKFVVVVFLHNPFSFTPSHVHVNTGPLI